MAWIEDSQLRDALKGALGIDPDAPTPPHLDKVVPWANRQAYHAIRAALIARGFSADQVDDWEGNQDFNERLGVCYAIKRLAMRGEGYDTAAAIEDCKDVVQELQTVAVVVDNQLATPANPRIVTGDDSTANDRFLLDKPDGNGDWSMDGGTIL